MIVPSYDIVALLLAMLIVGIPAVVLLYLHSYQRRARLTGAPLLVLAVYQAGGMIVMILTAMRPQAIPGRVISVVVGLIALSAIELLLLSAHQYCLHRRMNKLRKRFGNPATIAAKNIEHPHP
jgi:hypothetical protein